MTAPRFTRRMNEPPNHDERTGGIDTVPDRRRPARVAYRNPHLVALLRRQWRQPGASEPENTAAEVDPSQGPGGGHPDDLAAAQGIMASVLISLTMILAITGLVLLVK